MKRKYLWYILATAFIAVVAIVFFAPADFRGDVLQQADILQGTANGQEGKAYEAATGNTTRWTNSLFGGMPNFQISPTYPANNLLGWIGQLYMLFLPTPANLLFGMMIGFFIMGLCMKFRWHESLFGAIAWGFSSYFIILIGAGHIWKFVTLAYIPPTIGGLALLYRRKYPAGTALTALFAALQLQSNHPQMTYYFLFVVLALMIAWLCRAVRKHEVKQWLAATGLAICAGALAVGANSASLYNSYEYSKETVRGRATALTNGNKSSGGGMDRNAITAWSYGIDETWTLLIPNVKGGASVQPVAGKNTLKSVADVDTDTSTWLSPEERQWVGQFTQYFGDQPMTNGPVYVGAFVLLLAIMALFYVRTPMVYSLLTVSVLAILLSWGHNFPAFTDWMIDTFPGYNKFRAVSSILVIVEFCVPLLAIICIKRMLDAPEDFRRNPWTAYTIMGLGALITLLGWISPTLFGEPFSAGEIALFQENGIFTNPAYSRILQALREARLTLVREDCMRSFWFIAFGSAVTLMYLRGVFKNKVIFVLSLTLIVLIDLFSVNRRYVNEENFTEPADNTLVFEMTDADRAILQDKSNYRVLDAGDMGGARSSYFHKTIGGYHAAKLTRYNDLLEHQIMKQNMEVLNMLNTKYVIAGDQYQQNPEANGNAWFVESVDYVATPDAEMAALDTLHTKHHAVADRRFESMLGKGQPKAAGDTIYETSYAPDRLTYKARSARGGVAVFSEVYFPWGWYATIDGKPVDIARVNYTLRAIKVPAGNHDIEMWFSPKSLRVTNAIGVTSVIIIYIVCIGAVGYWVLRRRKSPKAHAKDN
ncbi:MAG: YfhO family protein [Muribaculaceae bacterium]|nr:YfhO family protein [Muribaculaceae bacterium]